MPKTGIILRLPLAAITAKFTSIRGMGANGWNHMNSRSTVEASQVLIGLSSMTTLSFAGVRRMVSGSYPWWLWKLIMQPLLWSGPLWRTNLLWTLKNNLLLEYKNVKWVSKHTKKPIHSIVLSLDWDLNSVLLTAGSCDLKSRVLLHTIKKLMKSQPVCHRASRCILVNWCQSLVALEAESQVQLPCQWELSALGQPLQHMSTAYVSNIVQVSIWNQSSCHSWVYYLSQRTVL